MIEVRYTCKLCGVFGAKLHLAYREHDEPIEVWMHNMTYAVACDHAERSPHCFIDTMSEIVARTPESARYFAGPPIQ